MGTNALGQGQITATADGQSLVNIISDSCGRLLVVSASSNATAGSGSTAISPSSTWTVTTSTSSVTSLSTTNVISTTTTSTISLTTSSVIANSSFTVGGTVAISSANNVALTTTSLINNTSFGSDPLSATGATVPAAARYVGGDAATSLPTAATAGNLTGLMVDKFGRQVTLPFAMRDLIGTQGTTITTSSAATIVTAGAAGVFNDLVFLSVTNTSATGIRADISDGTLSFSWWIPANDMRGGAFPTPIPATNSTTNWTLSLSSAITDVRTLATWVKNK